MADDKTYSEQEHLAILSDRVATETASLTAARDQLDNEKADLATKLDVAESARIAAETRATEAEAKVVELETSATTEREAAARKDERVKKVREAAQHLTDEFFTDDRVARITAMADEAFDSYVVDLVDSGTTPTGERPVPRETAMAGAPAGPAGSEKPSAARSFLLRNYEGKGE